jgi:hypothetical protein
VCQWQPERLNELLEAADVLLISAPLTRATYGLIGAEFIKHWGKSADMRSQVSEMVSVCPIFRARGSRIGAPSSGVRGVRLPYWRFLLITHRALRDLYQAQIRDQRVCVGGRASVQEG